MNITPINRKFKLQLSIIGILLLLILPNLFAYHQSPTPANKYTHQYITNESYYLSNLLIYEIKQHLLQTLNANLNDESYFGDGITGWYNCINRIKKQVEYSLGDDIITGSAEEDTIRATCLAFFSDHYWDPDSSLTISPTYPHLTTYYDQGLLNPGSSFQKALNYWKTEVIPNYLKADKENRNGDRNEAL